MKPVDADDLVLLIDRLS